MSWKRCRVSLILRNVLTTLHTENNMKTLLLSILMVLTVPAFARTPLRESAAKQRMLASPVVQACIQQLEKETGTDFRFRVEENSVIDLDRFTLSGPLLVGGDMAIGYAALGVEGSFQYPGQFIYTCTVLETTIHTLN